MNKCHDGSDFAPSERLSGAELKSQVETLSTNQEMVKILDLMPFLIMILNRQRQAIFINSALLQKLDTSNPNDIIGKRPGEIFSCCNSQEHPGGCGTSKYCRYCGAVNAIMESSRLGKTVKSNCAITNHDFDSVDLSISAIPYEMADGECHTLLIMHDISDSQRRTVLERIFFHDMLNLVGNLTSAADLAYHGGSSDNQQLGRFINRISDEMAEGINAQRDLVAAEDGRLRVNMQEALTSDLIESTTYLMKTYFSESGKILKIAEDSEDELLVTDVRLLRRVLVNMLKNAMESTEVGGTVTIRAHRNDAWIEFQVHNCSYIPEEIQLQLFKRSFSSKGEGHGVGTYSMKLLTHKYLHGRISFTSDPVKGTTFVASYPAEIV